MKTRTRLLEKLPYRKDGRWYKGILWWSLTPMDPMNRLIWKSNARMRLRKVWRYPNAQPISSRWSGHFARWWDHA